MSCPDIYVGPDRTQAPPNPFWTNSAIVPPTDNLVEQVSVPITVTVRNHGTDEAPPTRLQLFYANPTTGFLPLGSIGTWDFDGSNSVTNPLIQGATTIPLCDGNAPHTFNWTPPLMATLPNGGHVCLLARVYNTVAPTLCAQEIYGNDPTTDKLQGIHNIHVVAPPIGRSPIGGPAGGRREPMAFGFLATNTLRDIEDTRLTVRALDPIKDRGRLEGLVSNRNLDKALRARCLKFDVPSEVRLGEGRERSFGRIGGGLPSDHGEACCTNPFRKLGPLSPEEVERWRSPDAAMKEAFKAVDMRLVPGEMRQNIVQIRPSGKPNTVYAVEVEHEGADGRAIGGLTVLFVPPHEYF